MKDDDHKTKSIAMLVRSLLVQTILVLVLVVAIVYYMNTSNDNAQIESTRPAPCGMPPPENYIVGTSNGKKLFKANCSSCHTVTDKASTGPGLKGVLDRIPGGDWKYRFVRDHDALVKEGDPYAVAVSQHYGNLPATRFPKLTNEEIDAILIYASQ